MPLSPEQSIQLESFTRQVEQENPKDFIQFGANYFNKKLESQRAHVLSQTAAAASKGIVLFPQDTSNKGRNPSNEGDVNFKSPFISSHDPHSSNAIEKEPLHSGTWNTSVFNQKDNSHTSSPSPQHQEPQQGPTTSSFHSSQNSRLPPSFNALRRTSVSGETLQPDNLDNWTPDHYSEKSKTQLQRLEKAIGKNFLFNKLDVESKQLVISSLEVEHKKMGETIIKQGDEGDYFYVVERGTVDFIVNNNKVSSSGPGSSFGELALMYNSPRAATVVAATDCILWALDRITFRKILLGSSFKKRVVYDDLLKNVPILKSLTTYDRAKLADALNTEVYEPGETIVHEGEMGDNFYLIESGECEVSKDKVGKIATLSSNDYFGEVALLNDLPRQATVKAIKKTKVATLDKSGFQRLLGPAVQVLKLNDPTRINRETQAN